MRRERSGRKKEKEKEKKIGDLENEVIKEDFEKERKV